MRICKIEFNNKDLLDILRSPVADFNISFPLSYEIEKNGFNEIDKNLLTDNYSVLTQLASLYFYSCNLEDYEKISLNFVLLKTKFEKIKKLLHVLFGDVVIAELSTSLYQDKLIYISVRKITPKGEEILKQLICENKIPNELKELYVDKKISDDAVGLYRITDCVPAKESNFLYELCNDKYNNSLDISSLSLSECSYNSICNYIVAKKKNVYIYVSNINESGFKTKHLIWH